MQKASHYLHRYRILAALLALDGIFFALTNPSHLAAAGLIAGFVLLGLTIFALGEAVSGIVQRYGEWSSGVVRRSTRYMAGAIITLIGLQSIGQLSAKDVLVVVPLAVVLYWYLGYGKNAQAD